MMYGLVSHILCDYLRSKFVSLNILTSRTKRQMYDLVCILYGRQHPFFFHDLYCWLFCMANIENVTNLNENCLANANAFPGEGDRHRAITFHQFEFCLSSKEKENVILCGFTLNMWCQITIETKTHITKI